MAKFLDIGSRVGTTLITTYPDVQCLAIQQSALDSEDDSEFDVVLLTHSDIVSLVEFLDRNINKETGLLTSIGDNIVN